jgi:hypothetical protein
MSNSLSRVDFANNDAMKNIVRNFKNENEKTKPSQVSTRI